MQEYKKHEKAGNRTPPKKHNCQVHDSEEQKICVMPENELKIMILRKLSKIQKNIDRQFNKSRKTIYNLNEKFHRDRYHKKESEILELFNEIKKYN